MLASRSFAESADQHLRAGRAIIRRWKEMHEALVELSGPKARHDEPPADDPQSAPGSDLVVEHEIAELSYAGGVYTTRVRRQLRNMGAQPVTQYLIRIAVDRFPGDPERSNRLYREDPLTWEEVALSATCGDESMAWRVKHDRDAFKEVWLLFENSDGRFPLYPGGSEVDQLPVLGQRAQVGAVVDAGYPAADAAAEHDAGVPGGVAAGGVGDHHVDDGRGDPFATPIARQVDGERAVFSWSTDDPPLHARYRIEWKFRAADGDVPEEAVVSLGEAMAALGIAQEGEPVLAGVARPFELPGEAEDARRVVTQLVAMMERVAQVHNFSKGMGLAAPQVGIGRAAAVIRTPEGQTLTLLNPRVCDESADVDEQYEGCLSFFDVRGKVPRPLAVEVEHQEIDGTVRITRFERGMARLVCHEVDHLFGTLYRARMRPGVEPIPLSKYSGTDRQWIYP